MFQVAVDAYQGFNQYEQMSDAYFEFLQSFNDCKPPRCSPVTSDILLIPMVVESRHHFVMALVDIKSEEIYLADSLNAGRASPENAELLIKISEYVVKLLGAHGYAAGSPQEWALGELVNVPQQANGADCGVFDLLYADYFSRGRFPPFNFSQEHIPHFRRKMFKELNETTPSHYTSNFGLVQCK
ncbi:sentrin-specific protease 1-like protein [Aphelenchoides avenae]|nr:sentrin-specific protease 1-like protein [Aphelenchus avenae]